jgi:uncharacterized protein (TIGR03437 family)
LGAPEGANEAIISGDGAVAWVSTTTNRLLRYDLNQGTRQEVLSEFPGFTHNLPYGVPGSAVRFNIGTPVAGEHFRSNGLEFPIVATNDISQTAVQAPWELSDRQKIPASGLVTLTTQKDGYPFELPEAFGPTNQITPLFEFLPRPAGAKYSPVKAASSDFSHLIDDAHPALPGETIVVWMTGLGPLDQTLATGAPGPSNPPAHTLAHLDCGMASTTGGPAWEGTLVPFVGYAPGLVGFYQVNITIPIDWPAGPALLDCYSGAQSSTGTIPVGASKL